jgi:hypothetical protein
MTRDRSDENDGIDDSRDDVRRRRSQRDADLGGRDLLAMGRAAAARGDHGTAEALLTAALGSSDPVVVSEAAAALGAASRRDQKLD